MKISLPLLICLILSLLLSRAIAHPALLIEALVETRVKSLPDGELFWRVENYRTFDAAKAAAGPWSLVTPAAGKIWLFTLGPAGGHSAGASAVTEIGPIPRIQAAEYLLRINEANGPPGSETPVHFHPGSEAVLVLTGEQTINGPSHALHIKPGQVEAGHAPGAAMQVSSSGTANLHSLVMFVLDASKPFSSPTTLP